MGGARCERGAGISCTRNTAAATTPPAAGSARPATATGTRETAAGCVATSGRNGCGSCCSFKRHRARQQEQKRSNSEHPGQRVGGAGRGWLWGAGSWHALAAGTTCMCACMARARHAAPGTFEWGSHGVGVAGGAGRGWRGAAGPARLGGGQRGRRVPWKPGALIVLINHQSGYKVLAHIRVQGGRADVLTRSQAR